MLHQELPAIGSSRLDGWGRWLAPGLIAAAAMTVAVLLFLLDRMPLSAIALLTGAAGTAWGFARAPRVSLPQEPLLAGPDFSLLGSALSLSRDPTALTNSEG